jgi:twitching motility protein PilT
VYETKDLNKILALAVEKGASDIHLRVSSSPVFRIDGALIYQGDFPALNPEDIEALLKSVSTAEQRSNFAREFELDLAYSIPGLARFRVNAMMQRSTISLAIRLVPFTIPTIDSLELPSILKELVLRPKGLILVTGPTGSGKSTTLAAMINYLNENYSRNIVTIEDPIEYLHSNKKSIIAQRDLGDDTKSFSTALIHCLRHDPDVIVVGELRDLDTISTALTAVATGHLVLGTLHTIDSVQSIDRVINIFAHEQQRQIRLNLAQVIEAILSQRLLTRKNGGRIAAFEIMVANGAVRDLIREERTLELPKNMEFSSAEEGMLTMDQALTELVKNGTVAVEEAIAKSSNPSRLKNMLEYQLSASRF